VIVIAVSVIALDQASKWWAANTLDGEPPVKIIGRWLQLNFARNPGGAFSIGTNYTWLFTLVALSVVVAIVYFARRVTSVWWLVALGVLLGGAMGNLVDRMAQPPGVGVGHVVDFIQLPNFPVFNVADMAVVGSAIAIVTLSVLGVDPTRPMDDVMTLDDADEVGVDR
jgi:signal peptidase II